MSFSKQSLSLYDLQKLVWIVSHEGENFYFGGFFYVLWSNYTWVIFNIKKSPCQMQFL